MAYKNREEELYAKFSKRQGEENKLSYSTWRVGCCKEVERVNRINKSEVHYKKRKDELKRIEEE